MGIFNKIKKTFSNAVYELDIKKHSSIIDKINYLEDKIFYPYNSNFRVVTLRVYRDNIVSYNNVLNILKDFKYKEKVFIDSVSLHYYKDITLADWFCVNGAILSDYEYVFKEWLNNSRKVVGIYDSLSLTSDNMCVINNFNYYQTYIINMELIMDQIIECMRS